MGDVNESGEATTSTSAPSTSSTQPTFDPACQLPGTSTSTCSEPVMTEPQAPLVVTEDFLSTGRTGRRNALGDILDQNTAFLSTADLPDQMQALSFGPDQCAPSTSSGLGASSSSSSSSGSSSTSPHGSTSQQ